jgi:hypothetical protein
MYCLCVNVYGHRVSTQLQLLWLRGFLTCLRFFLHWKVFPCFFLSFKTNTRVKLAKTGHGPHSSAFNVICVVRLLFVLFYVLFVCKCVLPPGVNPIAITPIEGFLNLLRFFLLWQVFPCFFLSFKTNARVKLVKTGHGPHSSTLVICVRLLFVLFYVLFMCNATEWQPNCN